MGIIIFIYNKMKILKYTQYKSLNENQSNLTHQQQLLVKTDEFKKWFGDWENDPKNSSKIVGKNGEPLVVYHGTYLENGRYEKLNDITYFTDNKNTAYNYPIADYTYFNTFQEYMNELGKDDIEKLSKYYDIEKLKKGGVMCREDDYFEIWEGYDSSKLFVYECFINIRNPDVIKNADVYDITYISDIEDERIISAKKRKCDGIMGIYPYRWFSGDKTAYQLNKKSDYINEKHFLTFDANQIKILN